MHMYSLDIYTVAIKTALHNLAFSLFIMGKQLLSRSGHVNPTSYFAVLVTLVSFSQQQP